MNKYATVDDVISILKKLSDDGKGGYVVYCNSEYALAKKDDKPEVNDQSKDISLGGYYG